MMAHNKLWLPFTETSNYHKGRETTSVHYHVLVNLFLFYSSALLTLKKCVDTSWIMICPLTSLVVQMKVL